MYNMDIDLMQDDVFGVLLYEEICDNMIFSFGGQVCMVIGVLVFNVMVELFFVFNISIDLIVVEGIYSFLDMFYCDL